MNLDLFLMLVGLQIIKQQKKTTIFETLSENGRIEK